MTQKTALVTGCAGFIGSHLVDQLLERNYLVVGVDNLRTGTRVNLNAALEDHRFAFMEKDICDEDLAESIRSDVNVIYHLAAISSVKLSTERPLLVYRNNVTGTVNVLEVARQRDIERVVFSSSAAVYGNPPEMPVSEETPVFPVSPYAASKISAEQYVRAYGLTYGIETIVLRYFNIYGPRQAFSEYSGVISIFINQALRDSPITIDGDGSQTRSFLYVDDAITATLLAGEVSGTAETTLNVCGEESIRIDSLAQQVLKSVQGSRSEIVHGPPRVGDVKHSSGTIVKARELLGFSPTVLLELGVTKTVEWFRTHPVSR
ncbi:MAG: NAD-dependent epimerase/dehydratase family protein [Candidatus Thorarchaeota archaeon]